MPLYEYECDNGHRVEVIQKFSDPPLQVCSTCGAPVQKLQASPAFQFKGSGWYVTDYAKKESGGGKGEAKDKEASSTSEKSDAAPTKDAATPKAESKSETTPASGSKPDTSTASSKP